MIDAEKCRLSSIMEIIHPYIPASMNNTKIVSGQIFLYISELVAVTKFLGVIFIIIYI